MNRHYYKMMWATTECEDIVTTDASATAGDPYKNYAGATHSEDGAPDLKSASKEVQLADEVSQDAGPIQMLVGPPRILPDLEGPLTRRVN